MSASFSMLSIMNAALISQGFDEAVAENDGTPEFRALSRNWPTLVESELEVGNYHFTREQVHLTQIVTAKFGSAYAYLVPNGTAHVRHVWKLDDDGERQEIAWTQDGTSIHCDEGEGIYAEVVTIADPSVWSATFARGVQLRLEAVLLRLKEEAGEAERRDQEAFGQFEMARQHSSRARTAGPVYRRGPIAMARRPYGAH